MRVRENGREVDRVLIITGDELNRKVRAARRRCLSSRERRSSGCRLGGSTTSGNGRKPAQEVYADTSGTLKDSQSSSAEIHGCGSAGTSVTANLMIIPVAGQDSTFSFDEGRLSEVMPDLSFG
jgi:hypothetical protein